MAGAKEKTFEKQLERLQAVVQELEQGELPLEKGVALYKEGLGLAKSCREQLAKARNEITVFSEGVLREFETEAAGEGSDVGNG